MLLIGSQAVKLELQLTWREPKDYDFICTVKEAAILKTLLKDEIEAEKQDVKNRKIYLKLYSQQILELELIYSEYCSAFKLAKLETEKSIVLKLGSKEVKVAVASIEACLALKLSHRYKKDSPHFRKTMSDINMLRRYCLSFGKNLDKYQEFIKDREKETYTYQHPKLNQNKKDFFSEEGTKFPYVHDDIHEAVKWLEKPAYTYFKVDGEEVLSSKEKFLLLGADVKRHAVLEEAYVLALERSQIPFKFWPDRKQSFLIALEKVCTSITSGWFREFAWENYDSVLGMYSPQYVDKFHEALKAGKIRKAEQIIGN